MIVISDKQRTDLGKYLYVIRVLGGYTLQTLGEEIGASRHTIEGMYNKCVPKYFYLALQNVYYRNSFLATVFDFFTDESVSDSVKMTVANDIWDMARNQGRHHFISQKEHDAKVIFENYMKKLNYERKLADDN